MPAILALSTQLRREGSWLSSSSGTGKVWLQISGELTLLSSSFSPMDGGTRSAASELVNYAGPTKPATRKNTAKVR